MGLYLIYLNVNNHFLKILTRFPENVEGSSENFMIFFHGYI